jgi:hypothetical protein
MNMRATRHLAPTTGWRVARALSIFVVVAIPTAVSSCAGCDDGASREGFDPAEAGDTASDSVPPSLVESGTAAACELAAAHRSPLGCDYGIFAVPHGPFHLCTAVLISNPGATPARLSVESAGKKYELAPSARLLTGKGKDPGWAPLVDDVLPAGTSAVIALVEGKPDPSANGHCPFPALDDGFAFLTEEATRDAFRLRSDTPVFAAHFYNYGTTAQGILDNVTASTSLRAVPSWSSRYLDVGMYMAGRPAIEEDRTGKYNSNLMQAFAAIVAFEPTTVSLGIDGGVTSLALDAGEVHRFIRDDLFIGSAITADRPIGLFVGAGLAFLPYNVASADQVLNQVSPVDQWATEYAAVGHPPRRPGADDPPLYRIIAEKDDTVLEYDPAPPPGAPASLSAGGLAAFRSSTPFVVRSRDAAHRFFVSVAMTGGGPLCEVKDAGADDPDAGGDTTITYWHCPGDPELVMVPPPAEYAARFAFTTVHDFADTYVVLVRKQSAGRFADVTLDCAGKVEGWQPIDSQDTYETVTVPLSRGNYEPQVFPGGTCQLGAHTMSSDLPFTGFVWAWSHEGVDGLVEGDDGGGRSYGFALYGTDPPAIPAH